MKTTTLCYKIADKESEFDAIHKLNYATFVEEIPQHASNKQQKLIDKFHQHNTYIICLQGEELLGMLSVNDQRPFSLDAKLDNVDSYLPSFQSICEIRLLAIPAKKRHSVILVGILRKVFELASQRNYDLAIISGITKQAKLYKRLGFQAFGPLVGSKKAQYQPMYVSLKRYLDSKRHLKSLSKKPVSLNYLPGPVSIPKTVFDVYKQTPESHRSPQFMSDFAKLQSHLCQRLQTKECYIATGSGTLANDIIAAQLSRLTGKGVILVSGEFGRRLENQARCAGLDYDIITIDDGLAFSGEVLTQSIKTNNTYRWMWAVHCETSTGVLNNLASIQKWCQQQKVLLCLDSISTVGSCPVDLTGVYLASATSGKGIASLPGLALIFSSGLIDDNQSLLPRSMDLACYKQSHGVPYTISSNAIYALITALQQDWEIRFARVKKWSDQLYKEVKNIGLNTLANEQNKAPHVTTIALPKSVSSFELGKEMEKAGILISYGSRYLIKNNWIQICFMGNSQAASKELIDTMQQALIK